MSVLNKAERFWALVSIPLLVFVAFSPLLAVHAYGNTALWQVGISFTCNDPSFFGCHGAKIGEWGWIEFDSGGTGDAKIALYFPPPGTTTGIGFDVFLASIDITSWSVSTTTGTFLITNGSVTLSGGAVQGQPVTITWAQFLAMGAMEDTHVPAIPGHFTLSSLLGFNVPGVTFQLQVVQIPNR